MAKTAAQKQHDYRERKKAKMGAAFLKMETERVKGYYVPTANLSRADKRKRRSRISKNVAKFREKVKRLKTYVDENVVTAASIQNENHSQILSDRVEDDNGVSSTTTAPPPMVVKLPPLPEDNPYIGRVIDTDPDDVYISFMEQSKAQKQRNAYKWPNKSDKLWIELGKLLFVLEENPIPTGKTRRILTLHEKDAAMMEQFMATIL